MISRELGIKGLWEFEPKVFSDDRGSFHEWFKASAFKEAVGHDLTLSQANLSISSKGTVRGIHYAQVPVGQAKYVKCVAGSVLDVIVDIRVGSPTFGEHLAVELSARNNKSLYLSEGLGHAFCALEDDATFVYLCSTNYSPDREYEINPLDQELGITWPFPISDLELSAKDLAAPTLKEANRLGILPTLEATQDFIASL